MNRDDIKWHGSFAVIVTPFRQDGDVDEPAYRQIINHVIGAGCHGVITTGSTGEFFLMSSDERKRVVEICTDEVRRRVPVLAAPSATRTEDVVDFTKHARHAGCSGVMVMPPVYVPMTDRELIEFYSRVAGEGGLPIMLYNSPESVQANLTPSLVGRLAEIDEVVAIKDSSWDQIQVSNLLRTVGSEIRIFVGVEDLLLPSLAIGADGAVAMTPQIIGKAAVELYNSFRRGDYELAKALHFKMARLYDLFKIGMYVAVIKEAMRMLGQPGGYSRPPVLALTEEQRRQVRAILEDVGHLPRRADMSAMEQ
jgi:4-hydroxy-tetrahydrodipicolinate synthase